MKNTGKCIAVFLALWMTVQAGVVLAGAADKGKAQVFTDGVVGVINTDYHDKMGYVYGTASDPNSVEPMAEAAQDESGCLDVIEDGLLPMNAWEAMKKQAQLGDAENAKTEYHVGDKKVIWDAKDVPLECVYVGEQCTVWVDWSTETPVTDCVDLGHYFDGAVAQILDIFGDKRIDTDGDGKVALFIYDLDNQDADGFFKYADLADKWGRVGNVWFQQTGRNRIMCDCVHLRAHPEWPERLRQVAVHEYQHYIEASYCFVGKNNFTYTANPQTYITEGFSRCAEYLIYGGNDAYGIYRALQSPAKFSIIHHNYLDGTSYSLDYVFSQYIRTRYAALTGEGDGRGIYKKVLESRNKTNQSNTLEIIAKLLYPTIKNNDTRQRQLIEDFWLAVYLQEKEGVHGFNGETWANSIYKEYLTIDWSGKKNAHRSAMAAFYAVPTDGSITITETDKDVKLISLPDYNYRVTLEKEDGSGDVRKLRNITSFKANDSEYFFHRAGYEFAGWIERKGEDTYSVSGTVYLQENKTFSAMWKPLSTQASVNKTYSLGTKRYGAWLFTPDTDGEYTLVENGVNYDWGICSESGDVTPLFTEYDRNVYTLQAGQTYTVFAASSKSSATVRLELTEEYHTLTHIVTTHGQTFKQTAYSFSDFEVFDGTDIYRMTGDRYFVWDIVEETGMFPIGWSEKENATEPAYRLGDYIFEAEKDLTLYPVYHPVMTLAPGGVLELDSEAMQIVFFDFTPETDGQYCITTSEHSPSIQRRDADGIYQWTNDEGDVLKAGKTYRYRLAFLGNDQQCSVQAEKVSDKKTRTLLFDTGAEPMMEFHNSVTYTIPRVTPLSRKYTGFRGWSIYGINGGVNYKPGDKVVLTEDTVLYPVWEEEAITKNDQNKLQVQYVLRFIPTVLQIWILNILHK